MLYIESPAGVGFSRGPRDAEVNDDTVSKHAYLCIPNANGAVLPNIGLPDIRVLRVKMSVCTDLYVASGYLTPGNG